MLVLVAVWWLAALSIDSQILLPTPPRVLDELVTQRATLQSAIGESLKLYFVSLVLAILLGVGVGTLLGISPFLGAAFNPYVNALYVTPRIILVPLIIGWFGIYTTAKIILVVLVCVFEVLLFTRDGVREVSEGYVDVADVFGASRRRRVLDIYLPGAYPRVATGIRLAAGRAVTGVVVAEFFTAIFSPTDGVGAFIRLSAGQFRTAAALAGIIVLVLLGAVLQTVISRLLSLVSPEHMKQGDVRWAP